MSEYFLSYFYYNFLISFYLLLFTTTYEFLSNHSCKPILKVDVIIIPITINYSLILGNSYREI